MVESLRIKEYLGFDDIEVNFQKGLVVFTGSSGAGKSVFLSALLGALGYQSCDAKLIEVAVDNRLNLDEFGIESEDVNVFKCLKQKSMRYFINSNQTSQKNVKQISQNFINYLSNRDNYEFDSPYLVKLLDLLISKKDQTHIKRVEEFKACFYEFDSLKKELLKISEDEQKITELKEFARFEIEKIEKISPKLNEDEELMEFKRVLSKKEKITNALNDASAIFDIENSVSSALLLMEKKSDIFDEAMNYLRFTFESEKDRLDELDEVDIESILDRIEQISSLKSRFGSIELTLAHLQMRKDELARYENISFEKKEILKNFDIVDKRLTSLAQSLSKARTDTVSELEELLNGYLGELFLEDISFDVKCCEIDKNGDLDFSIRLNNTDIKKISSGEYSRLKLAFIAVKNELKSQNGGILILDEVDSNLSGKESMSVANVLKKISKNYQIFAISHHPQLSSLADQHFNIYKEDDKSFIKELDEDERVEELSRMISGKVINEEARAFAKELRKSTKER